AEVGDVGEHVAAARGAGALDEPLDAIAGRVEGAHDGAEARAGDHVGAQPVMLEARQGADVRVPPGAAAPQGDADPDVPTIRHEAHSNPVGRTGRYTRVMLGAVEPAAAPSPPRVDELGGVVVHHASGRDVLGGGLAWLARASPASAVALVSIGPVVPEP